MRYLVAARPMKCGTHRYFTIRDRHGASRVLTFIRRDMALRFRDYAVYHRHTYRCWPIIDASGDVQLPIRAYRAMSYEDICNDVVVAEVDESSILQTFKHNAVNCIEATVFDFDKDTSVLTLKGVDAPAETHTSEFREYLESMI